MSLGLVVFSGDGGGGLAAERWTVMAVLVAAMGWSCDGMFCFMVCDRKLLWEESKVKGGGLFFFFFFGERDVHGIYTAACSERTAGRIKNGSMFLSVIIQVDVI